MVRVSMKSALFSLACAAAALGVGQAVQAADPYHQGKTIKFIVGFGAGGGYDAYARMMAPYYEKILGTNVIVENQPGAGGMSALNRVYKAPGDGLTLHIVNGTGAGLAQLVGLPAARYDLTKFGNLGITDYSVWIWLVRPNSPINTAEDAIKAGRELSWGASGTISGISDGAAMTCAALNMKCKIVRGYKGSAAAALAVAQGEMDALYVSETSAFQYTEAKNAKAIANMARKRSELFRNVPTIFEQVKLTKEQAWWFDYRATLEGLGRFIVVPPGTPKAVLATLQDATKKILTDPKFLADAERRKRFIKYIPPEETSKMINAVLNGVTPAQKQRIIDAVIPKKS